MIVDSLDEAADRAGQALRLLEPTSLPGWRVVVTIRPAAWDATYRGGAEGVGSPRVVELQNLAYPDDVDAFIHAWFVADPGRGKALVRQVRKRGDLAEVAVIPLSSRGAGPGPHRTARRRPGGGRGAGGGAAIRFPGSVLVGLVSRQPVARLETIKADHCAVLLPGGRRSEAPPRSRTWGDVCPASDAGLAAFLSSTMRTIRSPSPRQLALGSFLVWQEP